MPTIFFLTLMTTSPWMMHGATTLLRTQPSPLPSAMTLWTEPSPLPCVMTMQTEPSPRPRGTTLRTQLSLRTHGKMSQRQPLPCPRAMTPRTAYPLASLVSCPKRLPIGVNLLVWLAAIGLIFPALVLGYYFFVKSMTYQFLYRLKNLYDYRWQQ
jgi:hypothetical protein